MIINERTSRYENVIAAARQLLIAARTAPKARGVDIIEAALIEGDELRQLADRMVEIGNERNRPSFNESYFDDINSASLGSCAGSYE